VDDGDLALRNRTYGLLVELGRAPTVDEVAAAAGVAAADVASGWRRLADAHAVVLDDDRQSLRMLHPFSAVPTPHVVHAAGRSWYANCAWDAFGICAALHVDGRIDTTCPDCGDGITVAVHDQRPDDETLVFNALVPAVHWWDDIAYT
jgi:hypothetical protein